jgi:hypothetical protein
VVYCDNQSCIKLYENPIFHDHSKHIDIKYHFFVGYVLYSLHVCVWARQIRQLRLTIPLAVFFVSCVVFAIFSGFLN